MWILRQTVLASDSTGRNENATYAAPRAPNSIKEKETARERKRIYFIISFWRCSFPAVDQGLNGKQTPPNRQRPVSSAILLLSISVCIRSVFENVLHRHPCCICMRADNSVSASLYCRFLRVKNAVTQISKPKYLQLSNFFYYNTVAKCCLRALCLSRYTYTNRL